MELAFAFALGVAITAVWCVLRLKGDESTKDAAKRIIPFSGGGPRPTTPK